MEFGTDIAVVGGSSHSFGAVDMDIETLQG